MYEFNFVTAALKDEQGLWTSPSFLKLAAQVVPERILGRRGGLLRSDLYVQWARWFVEGLADPLRYVTGPRTSYPHIFSDVSQAINGLFPDFNTTDRQELSSLAAHSVLETVLILRKAKKRRTFNREERLALIGSAGVPPRCWLCGTDFHESAIQNFTNASLKEVLRPFPFVDVLKPNGLKEQDLRIEIDHAFPLSAGGEEIGNLRLACGWCNRYKGARLSLYDVDTRPLLAGRNTWGISTLPHPFWTVRLLAIHRKCEAHENCTASADTHEMTVAPISVAGALSPNNLQVTCSEHDPLGSRRLQSPELVSDLWRNKSRD